MIKGLIAAILSIESRLMDDAERDPAYRRPNGRASDSSRYLRGGDQPEILRKKDDCRGQNRADAWNNDHRSFMERRIHECSSRRRHQHPSDATDGHNRPDQTALPIMR